MDESFIIRSVTCIYKIDRINCHLMLTLKEVIVFMKILSGSILWGSTAVVGKRTGT